MTATTAQTAENDRPSRSHSQLSDYLYCGWQYRLKRVLRLPERGSVWLAGGTAFHATSEAFDHAAWDNGNQLPGGSIEDWHAVWSREFEKQIEERRENDPDVDSWRRAGRKTAEKPNAEDIDWWAEAGKEFIGRYIDWRTSTVDDLKLAAVEGGPGIEVGVQGPVGGVPVRGYIDRVFESASDGTLLIVDMKTGSRKVTSPLQVALYSLLLEEKIGRPVTWGAYYDARKGVLEEPRDLTGFTAENLGLIYSNLDRGVQAGIFLPNIDRHCVSCDVRRFCVYQGGQEPAVSQG